MTRADHGGPPPLTRPPRLRPGDRVAIVSPSWGAAGQYPERLEAGIEGLSRTLGVDVVVMPHAAQVSGWVSGTAKERAADINAAFADPDIRAIICATAGPHIGHILDLIDYPLVAANPKIFVGYADVAALHHALAARAGLGTFSGPMVLTQWADWAGPNPATASWFHTAVMSPAPIGRVVGATSYTDERVSWTKRRSWQRKYYPAPPYTALRPGRASGPATMVSLATATALLRTDLGPRFDHCVLFVETPGHGYDPAGADRDLTTLRLHGVFDQIAALVLGRPYHFDPAARTALHELTLAATADYDFPILANVDIGHTDPQLTIALGREVEVDRETLTLLEPGVE